MGKDMAVEVELGEAGEERRKRIRQRGGFAVLAEVDPVDPEMRTGPAFFDMIDRQFRVVERELADTTAAIAWIKEHGVEGQSYAVAQFKKDGISVVLTRELAGA